jgi:hypothetical protein
MARLSRIVAITLAVLEHAGAMDPVRRTNQKAAPSDLHCVAWGDGPYFGRKFHSESEADDRFMQAKREELVAVHYDKRFREVQRFQSPRVTVVSWHQLADWCKENNDVEEPSIQKHEIVGAAGNMNQVMAHPLVASSLLEASAAEMVGIKGSSNLVGTVGVLEKELFALASKTSRLFSGIGQPNSLSDLKLGSRGDTLKARVSDLQRYVSAMLASTETLEGEAVGAAAKSQSWKEKISIKGKVDTLLPKVVNLKRRLLAMAQPLVISSLLHSDAAEVVGIKASSNLVGTVGVLEKELAALASKTSSLFTGIGQHKPLPDLRLDSKGAKLKARVSDLERFVSAMVASTKTLEGEIIGVTAKSQLWNERVSIKGKVDALLRKVVYLKRRILALEE